MSLWNTSALGLCAFGVCSLLACNREPSTDSSTPQSAPSAAASPSVASPPTQSYRVPSGPRFGVLPGEGLGPIRFGANTSTIERLMEAPCDIKAESLCRYINRGVDFYLEAGLLDRIHIHREDRPIPGSPGKTFGPFNGGFKQAIGFGMYRDFVLSALGKPEREEAQAIDAQETVQRDYYPGLTLEYDRLANGNVVLGGAVVTRAAPQP